MLAAVGCSGGSSQSTDPASTAGSSSTTTKAAGSDTASNSSSSDTSMKMDGSNGQMEGVVNQTVGYVQKGVYVDAAGKPLCPVLGHEVADVKDAQHTDYGGVRYYFCCSSCPGEFKDHTKAYAFKGKVVDGSSVVQPPKSGGKPAPKM